MIGESGLSLCLFTFFPYFSFSFLLRLGIRVAFWLAVGFGLVAYSAGQKYRWSIFWSRLLSSVHRRPFLCSTFQRV